MEDGEACERRGGGEERSQLVEAKDVHLDAGDAVGVLRDFVGFHC